jgi:GH35 family endo-1,4-beta-xylanase
MLLFFPACAADWKTRTARDIDTYRKRDVHILLVDAAGRPLPNVPLTIQQTSHAFPFGAAISRAFLTNPTWQQQFKAHFNYAVFENESKWYANEAVQGRVTYRDADALLAWCEANHIPVRGHNVFWEVGKWQQPWLAQLTGDDLRAAMNRRLDVVSHFQSRFTAWDVDNELLHGDFFTSRLGPSIVPWMFQQTRQRDPHALLFTNDYNILSVDQGAKQTQTDAYAAQIKSLLAKGAPIDAIGIQGHIWSEDILHHPEVLRRRLDTLATLGLPIWITEFDVADPDPRVRAEKLEAVYRTAFAHPAVQGIMMWVFWAGNSWRGPDAALFNQDWSINDEGRRYETLMAEWTTRATLTTGANGSATFRGFCGDYSITRTDTGQPLATFTLQPGKQSQQLRIVQP